MLKFWSKKQLAKRSEIIQGLRTMSQLEVLLGVEAHQLQLMAGQPEYRVFTIPKKDGSERWIEDPAPPLKAVQRTLNVFLQAVYYYAKTPAAYGFMVNQKHDPAPRNIITNAERHLGHDCLLNVDMKDFFHHVKIADVYRVFDQPPFRCEDAVVELMAQLCTHQGRLPMGAPTSPVLSNFATVALDGELWQFALRHRLTYTRYADDMSFSGNVPIVEQHRREIDDIVRSHGFMLNENKLKQFGPKDVKEVTGLKLGQKVEVPDEMLDNIEKDLERLQIVMESQNRFAESGSKWVVRFQQQVQGKIAFVGYVLGDRSERFLKLRNRYENAIDPPDVYDSFSWKEFPYFA
ncbi:MAG: reverse transcriptase family protein [Chitinophagales bacterium]